VNGDLIGMKKELEKLLGIVKWAPTEQQLVELARRIRLAKRPLAIDDVSEIVLSVVQKYEAMFLEGLDNSDLKMLLMLATKIPAQK